MRFGQIEKGIYLTAHYIFVRLGGSKYRGLSGFLPDEARYFSTYKNL